jgi:hypothetical protein
VPKVVGGWANLQTAASRNSAAALGQVRLESCPLVVGFVSLSDRGETILTELRLDGVLRSSSAFFVLRGTYLFLT